ncbi:hypothetical protein Q7Y93_10220, partial [Glaesserella parasuis]|nr:hypothetical protein [Glaesserella parasuis]MDP0452681.1 hypothetical protein [Glaesserella parasuis]MDP0470227.1 hypothetical protein [Glaesserella parasuis]MDP0479295.1 hypothetical protein [Glaesserella parasuis]
LYFLYNPIMKVLVMGFSFAHILIQGDKKISECSSGKNGVRADKSDVPDAKYLKSISVASGVITVAGKGNIDGYGYTMTPKFANNNITWATSCQGADISLFPANFCGQKATP